MKICYQPKRFNASTMRLILLSDSICDRYRSQDLTLTLRQLYYRLVSANEIPNNLKSYKRLQRVLNDARLAGYIDWSAIEDRTRNLSSHPSWSSPARIISSAAYSYQVDPWAEQDAYVEVWVEKDALIGVVERACEDRRVPSFSCRGFASQSEVHAAALRFKRIEQESDRYVHVIHLGDHDPSGIDMTRDIEDRFNLFGASVGVHRIALNYNQVEQFHLPPNPVKLTDSRASGYTAQFGQGSWELDALEPEFLMTLISNKIDEFVDDSIWDATLRREETEKADLQLLSSKYEEAITAIKKK